MDRAKPVTLSLRLSKEQADRLEAATKLGPYGLSKTEIVVRGIELAARELTDLWGDRK